LTSEEKTVLDQNESVKKTKFKLEELFDVIERGKRLKADDRIEGDLAFVTAGTGEMGLSSYIGNKVRVFPENSLTIDMFGTVFYRGYEFGADDHVAVLHDTSGELTRESLQYMQPIIEKTLSGMFSYSKNFYASDAIGVEIELPINTDNQLDVVFMTKFIKAAQKLTVQNVRKEMDSKLSAFQKVILN
jgi:Predicted membrane protein